MKNRILLIAGILSMCLLSAMSFSEGSGCSISAYTDNHQYIPGDRVYIYGGISGLCENAANTDVGVDVTGPGRDKVFADQIRTDGSGHYTTSFVAPLSMEPGTYTIAVSCTEASNTDTFEIESFFDILVVDTDEEKFVKGMRVEIEGALVIGGAVYENKRVAIIVKDQDGNVVYVSEAVTDTKGEFSEGFRIAHSMQAGEYRAYAAYEDFVEMSVFKIYPNVVINEVMFYPPGDDAGLEFIEFYNPYDEGADMNGWYIKSSWGALDVLFTAQNSVLSGGDFAVVTNSYSPLSQPAGGVAFRVGDSILGGLSNSGGTITLFDDDDNMIDSFTYKSSYGSDRDGSSVVDSLGEGSSLERIDPYVLTNYYANWDSSIGQATPLSHNTVYRGHSDANVSLLFADVPRYAMAGRNIDVNTRVMNSGPMYDVVTALYSMDGLFVGSEAILVDPASHEDNTYQFMSAAGDYGIDVVAHSSAEPFYMGDVKAGVITVVPAPDDESYRCHVLLPAIVPRESTFQMIALLINEYDDDVTDISVELALPQAGGFVMSDAPVKTLDALGDNSFDASMVYSVQALSDTPDEMLGMRTFSVYSEGMRGGEDTWDASYGTTEIIDHSSPVLSLDVSVPQKMDAGVSYELIGAAFNSGNEPSQGLIITASGFGIDVVSKDVVVFDELGPSSFEMFSFEVAAEYGGEHEIVLEIKDQDDNSYVLRKILNVEGGSDADEEPEDTGGSSGSSYSSSSAGAVVEDAVEEEVPEDDASEDAAHGGVDEGYAFADDDAPVEDVDSGVDDGAFAGSEKTPTGNVPGSYMTSRAATAVLGCLLLAVLLFYFKRKH